jgi:membrane protein DedA with SNARE-associated domain/membrane-associated phospholipid phosphatase
MNQEYLRLRVGTEFSMQSFLENIVTLLPGGGLYYLLIGAIALLESIVLVGLLVPGSTLVILVGFLAAHGKGEVTTIAIAAFTGAFIGDMSSYVLGSRFGTRLLHSNLFGKRLSLIRKAELFFNSHGGKSLFLGRFAGPLRGSIPFVAGCSGMRPGTFSRNTLLSCILWGIVYPGLGYLGAASWQKVQQLTGQFSLLLATLVVLFILNTLFWKKLFPRIVKRSQSLWIRLTIAWQSFLYRPEISALSERFPRLWTFAADRFSLKKGSGLYLTCGFAFSTLFAGLFFGLLNSFALVARIDQKLYTLFEQLHHPLADRLMLLTSSLVNLPALLIFCGLLLLWLVLNNRDFSAAILLVGMGGGELLVLVGKVLFHRLRPLPFFDQIQPTSASFPSGHAFSALLFVGLLAYYLFGALRYWQSRLMMVILLSFVPLMVGLSRCYLGLHWFSDIVAGYLLAATWLTFLLTTLEVRRRFTGEFPWRSGWQPLNLSARQRHTIMALAGCVALYALTHYLLLQLGLL